MLNTTKKTGRNSNLPLKCDRPTQLTENHSDRFHEPAELRPCRTAAKKTDQESPKDKPIESQTHHTSAVSSNEKPINRQDKFKNL